MAMMFVTMWFPKVALYFPHETVFVARDQFDPYELYSSLPSAPLCKKVYVYVMSSVNIFIKSSTVYRFVISIISAAVTT